MPDFPNLVTVDLHSKKLLINGVEFPWYITEEGPRIDGLMAPNTLKSVTLTIYTKDIEVIPENPFTEPTALSLNEMSERLGWPAHEAAHRPRATPAHTPPAAA
jgi:hypothetical protein